MSSVPLLNSGSGDESGLGTASHDLARPSLVGHQHQGISVHRARRIVDQRSTISRHSTQAYPQLLRSRVHTRYPLRHKPCNHQDRKAEIGSHSPDSPEFATSHTRIGFRVI